MRTYSLARRKTNQKREPSSTLSSSERIRIGNSRKEMG